MNVEQRITQKLAEALDLAHLQVSNESHQHNVPKGSESHFKVILVSDDFDSMKLLGRHRRVNQILVDEFANHIHALAIHTYTTAEWATKHGAVALSPPCLGGSKK